VYLGHVGIALGVRGVRRDVSLLLLLAAAYAPDWIDGGLCVVGAYDPRGMLSHSFPATALVVAVVLTTFRVTKRDLISGLVVCAVVVSHIVLDWITGYKPTWPGGPMIGLRLYSQPAANLVLETVVILIGVFFYRRSLPPRARPWVDLAAMAGLLIAMQVIVTIAKALTVSLPKC
jgi:membrane-bound metal-dependent hydrolase YbcI (DUF457 family)